MIYFYQPRYTALSVLILVVYQRPEYHHRGSSSQSIGILLWSFLRNSKCLSLNFPDPTLTSSLGYIGRLKDLLATDPLFGNR